MATTLTDGRRFHNNSTASYKLPNDAPEKSRLTKQHNAVLSLMHNQPIHSPLTNPKKILDIGCGVNASMTLYLAHRFPAAQVYGVDLSPIEPNADHPPNVTFIQGNIRDLANVDSRLKFGTFDYVYSRFLASVLSDWTEWVNELVRPLLVEGGYMEIHDHDCLDFFSSSDPPECLSKDWKWTKKITTAINLQPYELQNNIESIMSKAGFTNCGKEIYRVPWAPVEGKEETRLYGEYAEDLRETFMIAVEKLVSEEEGREGLKREVYETLGRREGMWFPLVVGWGRKGRE